MPLEPNARIGPYEILSPLGAGGMGEVYKARDTRLDRMVAVKVLAAHLAADPQLRQRFEREAKAISSLNHPNICTLHDIGHEGDVDYLVMELLEGETLAARLERGPIGRDEALPIAIQIADALDKAHRQGLIHRDLKPGNVMLTPAGAKLLDFGLAKITGMEASDDSMTAAPTMQSPLTQAGTMVGTFQYMAPEQLEGSPATPRSDIFAFGAVLYEMLTGTRPFGGRTQASLVASILKETPRPMAQAQPSVSPGLERLVQTCLEKNPDERRQSMHDILLELKWLARGSDRETAAAAPPPRRRPAGREAVAWIVAAAATLGAAGLLLTGILRPAPAPLRLHVELSVPEGARFEFRQGPMALSPDGREVAFLARDEEGRRSVYLRALDQPSARRIDGTAGASFPFWSPDGRSLGFFADGKLKRIEAAGGPADVLCDAPSGGGAVWSRDGFILFSGGRSAGLRRVSARGGEPVDVSRLDQSRSEFTHRNPSLLPDGEHFLYSARKGQAGGNELMLGSLSGGEPRSLLTVDSNAVYVPSGHILYWREGALRAHPFDAATLQFTGDPFPVAQGARIEPSYSTALFSASQTGTMAYYRGDSATSKSRLVVRDRDGKAVDTIGPPGNFYNPQISVDGKRVAVDNSGVENNGDIWVYEIGRPGATRLTFDPADESDPVWSPDGRRIAFWSAKAGGGDILALQPGGPSEQSTLLGTEAIEDPSDWSADGRFILFDRQEIREVYPDVYALSVEDGQVRPVATTPFPERRATFSPDTRWVAYTSEQSGRSEVYVQSFPDGGVRRQVSVAGGMGPVWRSDGREMFFEGLDGMLMAVAIDTRDGFDSGAPVPLFPANTRFQAGGDIDVFPDGQRFLINTLIEDESASTMSLIIGWNAPQAE